MKQSLHAASFFSGMWATTWLQVPRLATCCWTQGNAPDRRTEIGKLLQFVECHLLAHFRADMMLWMRACFFNGT